MEIIKKIISSFCSMFSSKSKINKQPCKPVKVEIIQDKASVLVDNLGDAQIVVSDLDDKKESESEKKTEVVEATTDKAVEKKKKKKH
jgi:hypothetical protein